MQARSKFRHLWHSANHDRVFDVISAVRTNPISPRFSLLESLLSQPAQRKHVGSETEVSTYFGGFALRGARNIDTYVFGCFKDYAKMSIVSPRTIIISTVPGQNPAIRESAYSPAMSDDLLDSTPGRKRRRLTHLSPDERLMRRFV